MTLTAIKHWCCHNCINLNISKTKLCLYGTRSMVDNVDFDTIEFDGSNILRCKQYTYLGISLDECLNLKSHYNTVFKKFSYKAFQFGKIWSMSVPFYI